MNMGSGAIDDLLQLSPYQHAGRLSIMLLSPVVIRLYKYLLQAWLTDKFILRMGRRGARCFWLNSRLLQSTRRFIPRV